MRRSIQPAKIEVLESRRLFSHALPALPLAGPHRDIELSAAALGVVYSPVFDAPFKPGAAALHLRDFQSDGLAVMIGANETIEWNIVDGGTWVYWEIVLPDDAILLRNSTELYFCDDAVFWNASGTVAVALDYGAAPMTDLENAGFTTHDPQLPLKADELQARGWITDAHRASFKFAVIGDDNGGFLNVTVASPMGHRNRQFQLEPHTSATQDLLGTIQMFRYCTLNP